MVAHTAELAQIVQLRAGQRPQAPRSLGDLSLKLHHAPLLLCVVPRRNNPPTVHDGGDRGGDRHQLTPPPEGELCAGTCSEPLGDGWRLLAAWLLRQ